MAISIAARMENYHEFRDQVHCRQRRVTTVDRRGTDLVYPIIGQHLTVLQSKICIEYPPLESPDQIRLLKIHPGEPDDSIEISFVTASLNDTPDYDALSYTWGSLTERSLISVNGDYMPVPRSAFKALHALRRSSCERLICVDALGINQQDIHEKSHQVRLMCDIYQGARSVVIYLGDATDKTFDAMRSLQYLIQARKLNSSVEPPWTHKKLTDVEDTLQDILKRPWFTRMWTVQEATLARHTILLCGDQHLSWNGNFQTLRRIAFRIKIIAISPYFSVSSGRKSKLDWSPFLDIIETQMRQAARREGVSIQRNQLDLAFQFRHRRCSDTRDNYFALSGIMESENRGPLEFNTDYALNLEEVHLRFMEEIQRISEIEDAPTSPTPNSDFR